MSKEFIPIEHQLECPTCGKIIDMRDLGQALSHGNWNGEKFVCEEQELDLPYKSSKKVGEPVEWTKDKKQIDLN